jgi:DNA-directed RNA polymerase subunit RPC12/RpoP
MKPERPSLIRATPRRAKYRCLGCNTEFDGTGGAHTECPTGCGSLYFKWLDFEGAAA